MDTILFKKIVCFTLTFSMIRIDYNSGLKKINSVLKYNDRRVQESLNLLYSQENVLSGFFWPIVVWKLNVWIWWHRVSIVLLYLDITAKIKNYCDSSSYRLKKWPADRQIKHRIWSSVKQITEHHPNNAVNSTIHFYISVSACNYCNMMLFFSFFLVKISETCANCT